MPGSNNVGASQSVDSRWNMNAPQFGNLPKSDNPGNVYTPPDNLDTTGGYPYGYGGGYGSGYGSGGDSGPTKNQVEMAKNLGPLAKYGQDIILGKANNAKDVYNTADQDARNSRNYQAIVAKTKAASEWHPLETALQRAEHQLRLKMGNAAYGSSILDHLENVGYKSDVDARGVLDALRETEMDINNEYYNALARTINGWNELAMDTEDKVNQSNLDYLNQLVNIHPDLASGKYEGTEENGDAGTKWPQLINTDTGKINFPDWAVTSYYADNKKSPVDRLQGITLFTPDNAADKAAPMVYGKGNGKNGPSTREASANAKYWDRLTRTYAAREV